MRLSWVGSRCGISTNARPLSAGMCVKNLLKASSPPAEAPMPTTGSGGRGGLLARGGASGAAGGAVSAGLAAFGRLDFRLPAIADPPERLRARVPSENAGNTLVWLMEKGRLVGKSHT